MEEITGPLSTPAAFNSSEVGRPDKQIIASPYYRGVAAVSNEEYRELKIWLTETGYETVTIDFTHGLASGIDQMNNIFRWEEQFGYTLSLKRRNLDAINDGFGFDVSGYGLLLEIVGAEVAWRDDRRWFKGLLSIASDHSHSHLSVGNRFLTVVPVQSYDSPLVGKLIHKQRLGWYWRGYSAWPPARKREIDRIVLL